MTLMVLAIRLYDVGGCRDDAVFWFYAAENRYLTLEDVRGRQRATASPRSTPR